MPGEWTDHALAGDEAMKIADDGLRNCWCMLQRLKGLARTELERMTAPNAELSRVAAGDESE